MGQYTNANSSASSSFDWGAAQKLMTEIEEQRKGIPDVYQALASRLSELEGNRRGR